MVPVVVPVVVPIEPSPGPRWPTPVSYRALHGLLARSSVSADIVTYLVDGFRHGFHIGHSHKEVRLPVPRNLVSARLHSQVVERKLEEEVSMGRISGPHSVQPFKDFVVSPMGVVPKKEEGKFRRIHHLSYPEGLSVNDHIAKSSKSVQYQTVDDAVCSVYRVGRSCWMAKTDIQSAYRIVPVHPEDYRLLGMTWKGKFYYDKCLPMGCASACAIFQRFSGALKQAAIDTSSCQEVVHVLDDFLFLSSSEEACSVQLDEFLGMCASLGVPMSPEKTEKPARVMVFLGIEIDTVGRELRLPLQKVRDCQEVIQSFLCRAKATLREFQSLVGKLQFACCVLVPGRAFLRRLIDRTIGIVSPFHNIRVTAECKEDLRVWLSVLREYNGRTMFLEERWTRYDQVRMYTDASGSIGYGALLGSSWCQGKWPLEWCERGITFKEMVPILMALKLWGCRLQDKRLVCYTDNMAVMAALNSMTCKCPHTMWLLRRIVAVCMRHNVLLSAVHVPGVDNGLADALSRFQVDRFWALVEEQSLVMDPEATPIAELSSL